MRNLSVSLGGLVLTGVALAVTSWVGAADPTAQVKAPAKLAARLQTDYPVVRAGTPVWAVLALTNLTAEPLTLEVPQAEVAQAAPGEMGLPLEHVFSGKGFTGLTIQDEHNAVFGENVAVKPHKAVPVVKLAANGSVGIRVELSKYYDALLRPGIYQVVWRPYHAAVESAPLAVTVLAEQQAVIVTDFGEIAMRFYYEEAPNHVQNFLELVREGFYDNLTFHRVIPGGIIQGGDPQGDGRGTRPDGKRLKAEFSRIPFELGTVGMARSLGDPDSASCQFFICLSRQPSFDGQQTAFAHAVGSKSFETLRQIGAIPTGPKDKPIQPVYIQAISLENVPPRERAGAPPSGSRRQDAPDASGPAVRGSDGGPVPPPVTGRRDAVTSRATDGAGPATRPAGGAVRKRASSQVSR